MDDIEKAIMEYRKQRDEERKQFLQKGLDKMNGELAYHSFVLLICARFGLDHRYCDIGHILAEHFIADVDEPFNEWINKKDAPFVRPLKTVRKIFPEFSFLEHDWEVIELANKIYGLDLQIDEMEEYMYSFGFDFESFTPINVSEIKELKTEISILEKHGIDCSDLKKELMSYGLTEEQLELI